MRFLLIKSCTTECVCGVCVCVHVCMCIHTKDISFLHVNYIKIYVVIVTAPYYRKTYTQVIVHIMIHNLVDVDDLL